MQYVRSGISHDTYGNSSAHAEGTVTTSKLNRILRAQSSSCSTPNPWFTVVRPIISKNFTKIQPQLCNTADRQIINIYKMQPW